MDDFSKPKIVWGEISDKTKFALDIKGEFWTEATPFFMTGVNLPYLVCFLNSTLSEYLFSNIGTTTGVGTVRWKKFKIEQLFASVVDKNTKPDWCDLFHHLVVDKTAENTINRRIYALCGLSAEEIAFIENYSASI